MGTSMLHRRAESGTAWEAGRSAGPSSTSENQPCFSSQKRFPKESVARRSRDCQRWADAESMRARKRTQGRDPERLDLDGIAFARCSSGMVGIHPGEVGRAPNQRAGGVDSDPVGGALQVAFDDPANDRDQGRAVGMDGEEELRGTKRGGFLDDADEPERGVAGVAVGSVVPLDRVRERSSVSEPTEDPKDLVDVVPPARGEQASGGDESVAAPVQEPGVSGDDGATGSLVGPRKSSAAWASWRAKCEVEGRGRESAASGGGESNPGESGRRRRFGWGRAEWVLHRGSG